MALNSRTPLNVLGTLGRRGCAVAGGHKLFVVFKPLDLDVRKLAETSSACRRAAYRPTRSRPLANRWGAEPRRSSLIGSRNARIVES